MATLRVEFVVSADQGGAGPSGAFAIQEVIGAVEVEAGMVATLPADQLSTPEGTTHVVFSAFTDPVYIAWVNKARGRAVADAAKEPRIRIPANGSRILVIPPGRAISYALAGAVSAPVSEIPGPLDLTAPLTPSTHV